jgi:small subunit ribosomal protein S1
MASSNPASAGGENFADLLEESLRTSSGFDGRVTTGRVISIEGDFAIIDVGLKAEGRRCPRLVFQDRGWIVPGPAAQVEAGVDPRGDSALAGEKGVPDSGHVQARRGQEGRRGSAHVWAPNPGGLRPGE